MNLHEAPITTPTVIDPASVDAAIRGRYSARAFLPQPVPRELLTQLLRLASCAPSGVNTQPWKVYVLQGASRDALVQQVCAAQDAARDDPALAAQHVAAYDYYPAQWFDPYLARRRENGWGLYGLLGITKGDKEAMYQQHQRNYRLFDAPVGIMLTIDRRLGRGSLLDAGMFLQNLMIAARAHGLDTCPQAAWLDYHRIVMSQLGAGEDELLVCGVALGYADPQARVNEFRAPRLPVDSFTTWLD
ncbi:nitroreductase [Malikia sp.]|uniref:nitroreductase n=1 Tax=Malikia sp. TaxID=2070706 RepID=UPI0026125F56|nr:nitroreductase [Malikia sp.]MDD2729667.1 nitroreductase [Malikia sp.]